MSHALLLAPATALLLLAAHFHRAGAWLPAAGGLLLVGLVAVPRRWAVRVVQAALLAGCVEWLWTAALLAQQRIALGRPWGRMAAILGLVALLTAAATLVWRHPRLRGPLAPRPSAPAADGPR